MIVMVVAFLLLNDVLVSALFLLIRTLFFKSILRSNFERNSALRIGNFTFAIMNSCLYFLVVPRFMFRLRLPNVLMFQPSGPMSGTVSSFLLRRFLFLARMTDLEASVSMMKVNPEVLSRTRIGPLSSPLGLS